jgi:hypothetical protein
MSSFQLNLSLLTLNAKERLAWLEASGARLPYFLSPSQGIGVPGGSPSGPPSPRLRGLRLDLAGALVGGVSGESLLSGGSLVTSLLS